jgi:SpoVK/Ycf46/Vps4 family AAA+-type ATPase
MDYDLSDIFQESLVFDTPHASIRRRAIEMLAAEYYTTTKATRVTATAIEKDTNNILKTAMKKETDMKRDSKWRRTLTRLIDVAVNQSAGQSLLGVLEHATQVLNLLPSQESVTTDDPGGDEYDEDANLSRLLSTYVGLEPIIDVLTECILWPRLYYPIYNHFMGSGSVTPAAAAKSTSVIGGNITRNANTGISGILLYGPPGTGKTFIVNHIHSLFNCRVLNIHISELIRGTIGTGEKALKALFQQAKQIAPCVIFFDEFQSIFTNRSKDQSSGGSNTNDVGQTLSSTLSGCFDDLVLWNKFSGENSSVTVIAATNEPWSVDKGFLRSGRFEKLMFIGPSDSHSRRVYLQRKYSSWPSKHIEWLVNHTKNFTGADITLLEQRAWQIHAQAFPQDGKSIPPGDSFPQDAVDSVFVASASVGIRFESFKKALKRTSATVTVEDLEDYHSWERLHR